MSKWAIYRVLYVELSTRHVHALHPLIPYTLLLHSSCGQSAAFVVLHRPCPVIATSICTCHMVCVLHEKYFDVKPAKVCSGVCVCVCVRVTLLLVQVFDQALAGGGAKNINFQYACHPHHHFESCIAHVFVLHVGPSHDLATHMLFMPKLSYVNASAPFMSIAQQLYGALWQHMSCCL